MNHLDSKNYASKLKNWPGHPLPQGGHCIGPNTFILSLKLTLGRVIQFIIFYILDTIVKTLLNLIIVLFRHDINRTVESSHWDHHVIAISISVHYSVMTSYLVNAMFIYYSFIYAYDKIMLRTEYATFLFRFRLSSSKSLELYMFWLFDDKHRILKTIAYVCAQSKNFIVSSYIFISSFKLKWFRLKFINEMNKLLCKWIYCCALNTWFLWWTE